MVDLNKAILDAEKAFDYEEALDRKSQRNLAGSYCYLHHETLPVLKKKIKELEERVAELELAEENAVLDLKEQMQMLECNCEN